MLLDSDTQALNIGMELMRGGQPLAAAIVWADLARGGMSSAQLWCGLGSALMQCRGRLVRRPFELWAGKVFNRGSVVIAGTGYAETTKKWLEELPEAPGQPMLADAEIFEMIEFLLVNERVLPDAVAALPEGERMGAVMVLGDRGAPLYVPLLRHAIAGELGGDCARAAAKRIFKFVERADVQASIEAARDTPIAGELGPYLTAVIDRLPSGWDAPRRSACPPYQGIGRIDIELVSPGPQPGDCAELLRPLLGASARDAASWVRYAPCMIKKGAMRADALELRRTLEPVGARLELHGFTWSHESQPSEVRPPLAQQAAAAAVVEAKKPWWKLW